MTTYSDNIKLSQYNFSLPSGLIAKYPTENRDESRLMVINTSTGDIKHLQFKDIVNCFTDGDTFVFNNTKVYPAKLQGYKESTSAPVEVILIRELDPEKRVWDVIIEPARKIRIGNKIVFGDCNPIVADVLDNTYSKGRIIRFLPNGCKGSYKQQLFGLGKMSIPAMLNRVPEQIDIERFQTIFAQEEGAVIAPGAGLHFSRELLKKMDVIGIEKGFITLHIGLGNIQAPKVFDLAKHRADSEPLKISEKTTIVVNKSKHNNKHICAIGISSLKAIESSVNTQGLLMPFEGWTNKFIYPPFNFKCATALVTNFHLPFSPLLMAASAFSGYNLIMDAYQMAIKNGYRFGVYGDAMLILKSSR